MSSSIFSINYINPRPITYSSNPVIFPIKTQDSIGHLSPQASATKGLVQALGNQDKEVPKVFIPWGNFGGKTQAFNFACLIGTRMFDDEFLGNLNLTQIHGVFNCCLHLPLVLVLKHVSFISFSSVT